MDKIEREILLNQFTILMKIAENEGDNYSVTKYEEYIKIISSGYTIFYDEFLGEIENEMTKEDQDFVLNVLQMYSDCYVAYSKYGLDVNDIRFKGFDGNYEDKLRRFCVWFLKDMSRFGELQLDPKDDYNSHCQMTPKYHRMLETWNAINDKTRLTIDQVKQILAS